MYSPLPVNCHWQPLALVVQGSIVQAQNVPDVKAAKPDQRIKTLRVDLATGDCTVSRETKELATQTRADQHLMLPGISNMLKLMDCSR